MNDMSRTPLTNEGEEVPFSLAELFYSRTDLRGVIRTGNTVFQRVSGYDWGQLFGAPHRIVRHPDMPRGVFHLLWQTIRRGEPVVAYVLNRASGGGHYWVLATMLPVQDGYLSIRIKPTTSLLATVKQLYADLLAEERDRRLSPEASAARLIEGIQALGYADYASFMQAALLQEYSARNAVHARMDASIFSDIDRVSTALHRISEEQGRLIRELDRLRDLPTNLRIIASRLEPSGGPVSAISETYNAKLVELTAGIRATVVGEASQMNVLKACFAKAVMQMFFCRLQFEACAQLTAECMTVQQFDVSAEELLLFDLMRAGDLEARSALSRAVQIASSLKGHCSDIRRSTLGLDTIRVMGRVESERIGVEGAGLAATIDQLDVRHVVIIERLESIMNLAAMIDAVVVRIRSRYKQL